ncbi:MAG TPA: DUF4214 domain-containing protein [Pyrinomonadaceae bacterium]|jgi:hypothetical protein
MRRVCYLAPALTLILLTACAGSALARAASAFSFGAPGYTAGEGDGAAVVTVTRTGDASAPASVDYATSEGTASRRSDFTPAFGTLRFAPGETAKTFKVLLTHDRTPEEAETVELMLFNPSAGASVAKPDAAVLTVTDDDAAPADANPIDDSRAFVRQHYQDFLNREPDEPGLNFWTNEIEQCGADAQCREVKRINVSAAFFLSIEFQQTAYFVRRLYLFYQARLSPVWREFMRDTQELGRGVVVGEPGWEGRLAANRRAFVEDWYARHLAVLESQLNGGKASLTNEEYVSALFRKVAVTPTEAERQALVEGLNAGTETRAGVLGRVADHPELVRREFNRAFVMMQYFGYLRREPDSGGYNFWLGKLNQFDGDYIAAEMVKAFISSIEYRERFTRSDKLEEAFFEFTVSPSPEKAVFRLSDPARIAEARSLAGRSKIIIGTVLKEPIYYNRPWSFHLDPESIRFGDFAAEVCDTGIPPIEEHLESVGGSLLPGNTVCPWRAGGYREVPPPAR